MKAIGIEIVWILERGLLSAHHLVCLLLRQADVFLHLADGLK